MCHFLHTVELGDYNKDEGLELLGDLRSSRQKRRNYKDKQEVMNMLLGGDENTGSQHAMDTLDKIKEVTSPRSYQYRIQNSNKNIVSYYNPNK